MSSTARTRSDGVATVRPVDDFYRTPAWATRAILPHLPAAGSVLDPCAGDGTIIQALLDGGFGGLVDAMEIDGERAAAIPGADVLVCDALTEGEDFWAIPHALVVMNPPFRLALRFVERALDAQDGHRGTTAALLRLGMLASQARASFWRAAPADVYVLPRRPSFTGGGTDSADYAWFVWGPGRGGRWQVLDVESARGLR